MRTHVVDNLVNSARGIMQRFQLFGTTLSLLTFAVSAVLSSAENLGLRFVTKLSIKYSLLLDLVSGALAERRRTDAEPTLEIINKPQRGSTLFYFMLHGAGNFNKPRSRP